MRAGLERLAERAWTARSPGARAVRATLVPAALVYGVLATLRNRLYDTGWLPARRVPARVVSVGNLSVGGTGKTPTALWLAERFAARGCRTAIVARGYGKRRRGVVVVGEAGRPLVGPEEGGDEAVMLARRFRGPVVTGERRVEAASLACGRFALDVVILDDGFQHRALARDADLVLATQDRHVTWTLPAGPLREPRAALVRARALLAVDEAPPPPSPTGARLPLFRGWLRPTALVRAAEGTWLEEPLAAIAGREVIAVAGVARPERFVATLTRAGTVVRRLLRFPDHHAYGPRDVARLAAVAGEGLVVTTEKDLAKLALFPALAELRALRVSLEVEEGDTLVELLAEG